MDELQLVNAARQGDLAAFNQLVLRYQGQAYNVAYRVVGHADLAADATQDAFLKAYKSLGSLRGELFRPWLLRIVTNSCYDKLRAVQRQRTSNLDDLVEDEEHSVQLLDHGESPQERVERQELGQYIQWALSRLPEDQRTAVILSDIEGLAYEEIAVVMGTSLGTVKSRLSRARSKMRDLLQRQPELLPDRFRLTNA